jgi:hypothetical protein
MRQVIHIFRKDVRHLWREIVASLALLVIYVWSEPATWADLDTARNAVSSWLNPLLPVSWWLLVVRVVQDEPLVGDRQFWVTRPYRWTKLLAAKLLFLAAFISVPLSLAQLSLLWLAGFPPSWAQAPGILWLQLMWAFVLLGLVALAAITKGIGQMTLVMLGIGLYLSLSAYLSDLLPQGVSRAEGIPNALVLAIAVCLCAGVTLWQYARRQAGPARFALATTALVPFLVGAATPHRLLADRYYPEPASAQLAPVQLAFVSVNTALPRSTFSTTPYRKKKDLVVLQPELHVTGIAAHSMPVAEGERVEIEGPDGFRWDSGWGPNRMQFRDHTYFRSSIMLEPVVYERVKDVPVKLRISFAVSDFSTQDSHEVLVSEDDFAVPNLGLCRLVTNTWNVQCRFALRRRGYLVGISDGRSTCPGLEQPQSTGGAKSETWQPAEESMPAEFGISPVQTINLSMRAAGDKPLLCPGTPMIFTSLKETGRARISLVVDGIRLSNYRQSGDTYIPPGTPRLR